ncbi:FAD-binding monooxygenase [Lysinibacter sp. HNR]|uniref:FAD-binding monooxygenase n=1 Tax=Lysinibacter sp. HNR TaxID=3031408 RepID=UPI0024352144|nr:FAD-binding monooxygenase [Lysinibacter sp. HNR]WGD37411.1 FAD-binding monooxygenase [Lysinibacter sp. HNR]
MQFHHHGYVSADPRVQPAAGVGINRPEELPAEVDVLIVGSGPAGIITAAQLAQFPGVVTRVIEQRPHRLMLGHADGIQARSVETFQAFGFAEQIIQEAYQITEMMFWKPDPQNLKNIVRAARVVDDPGGISEFPHLIVNQARVIDYFAQYAKNSPARLEVDYGYKFVDLEVTGQGEYPVTVTLEHTSGPRVGESMTVRAKYVVGANGAHSEVRHSIGGRFAGDQAYHAWGVMDVLAMTDFPDIRKKCAIQSEDGGNILHIPREGNYLFRMYVDLGEVAEDDKGRVRETSIEQIIQRANAILYPYSLDVRDVAWHSVYEVAHRLTDRFDDAHSHGGQTREPRVFLMGDACHTHSAKAGQGMNVSMQDGWNLAWKLGYVLEGRSPEALLETYSDERQVIAQNLIDFDKEWSTLMARRPEEFDSPSQLEDFYVQTAEFPAGFMTQYQPSMLTAEATHQGLATGFPLGKRFKSAQTVRVADGVPVHLGHHHRADGRYRIYAFADERGAALDRWAEWMLDSPDSPVERYTPAGTDRDHLFDVKAVYQQPHFEVDITRVSRLFLPLSGPLQLVDYEKIYAAVPEHDIFEERGISREGVVVVVRPDHYVAHVLPLTATAELAEFFEPLFLER